MNKFYELAAEFSASFFVALHDCQLQLYDPDIVVWAFTAPKIVPFVSTSLVSHRKLNNRSPVSSIGKD